MLFLRSKHTHPSAFLQFKTFKVKRVKRSFFFNKVIYIFERLNRLDCVDFLMCTKL